MNRNIADDEEAYSQLIKDVVIEAQSETKSQEAHLIHEAIHFYLMAWLKEAEKINPLFKVKELIGVGSYAEGTKIIEPNEFDFLAVIDDFSKPNLLSIDQEESNFQEGLVKINVKDDELKLRSGQLCKNGHLQCFQPTNFPNLDEKRFGHVFIEAILLYAKNNEMRMGVGSASPTTFIRHIQLPSINNISLLFVAAEYHIPNVLIDFKYKDTDISIDLSPAIRYYQPEDCFKVKKCAGPGLAELVLSRKSLLLIGTQNESDFKITITEAEVEYIKSVMKYEHKIIYILLKYVTKMYKDKVFGFPPFTSYMMKTVCFHHDTQCETREASIKQCLRSVIEDLMICTKQKYVTSILDNRIHLKSSFDDFLVTDYRTSMLGDMRAMCSLSVDIKTVEAFDEFLEGLVRTEKLKRDKVREESEKLAEKIRNERQQKISQLTDMGFETEDVKRAMDSALDMTELALAILRKEADERKDKDLSESDRNTTIQPIYGLPPAAGQSSVPRESSAINYWESTDSTGQSQNENSQLSSTTTSTFEVIYERQKH